jgi:hypothetical protein
VQVHVLVIRKHNVSKLGSTSLFTSVPWTLHAAGLPCCSGRPVVPPPRSKPLGTAPLRGPTRILRSVSISCRPSPHSSRLVAMLRFDAACSSSTPRSRQHESPAAGDARTQQQYRHIVSSRLAVQVQASAIYLRNSTRSSSCEAKLF